VGVLALSLPLSAILAVRMPTVKANMNAAVTAIMPLVIMGSPLGFEVTLHIWQLIQPLPVMAVTNLANTAL